MNASGRASAGSATWSRWEGLRIGWRFVAIGGALRHQPGLRCHSDATALFACLGL